MLKRLYSLFFPSRSSLITPSKEEQKLKVLLVHQNMNLSAEQRDALFYHIQEAVQTFVHTELMEETPHLQVVEERQKKA